MDLKTKKLTIHLDTTQKRDSPNRQPFSYEYVAAVKENGRVRCDELPRSKLGPGLVSSRAHITVRRFPIAKLSDNFVITIQNANLAIEVRAYQPLFLVMKVARHAQMGFLLDCAEVLASWREGLDSPVSAISHHQQGFGSAWIDPQTMWSIKLAVAMTRPANFSEKFPSIRKTKHVVGSITVAYEEIAVRSESYIGGHEVDRLRAILLIFSRITVGPDHLASQGRFHDFALVDVTVIQELFAIFSA